MADSGIAVQREPPAGRFLDSTVVSTSTSFQDEKKRFTSPTSYVRPEHAASLNGAGHFAVYSWQRLALVMTTLLSAVNAQDPGPVQCSTEGDLIRNYESTFRIPEWIQRGICVRSQHSDLMCYTTLLGVLKNLDGLRSAEYSGAAGTLALLPTIGALLGAPTNEIWRLLTVVPFGGIIAMTLSFGGAILPTRVQDYEDGLTAKLATGSNFSFRKRKGMSVDDIERETEERTEELLRKLDARIYQDKSVKMGKGELWLGLFGMVLLFIGSQAAIIVVEQGGVLPWWCVSRWWFHMWYFMVTATALAENLAQLPFRKQWKLFVSDVPYNLAVTGGEDITVGLKNAGTLEGSKMSSNAGTQVELALKQLPTLLAGTISIDGSLERTEPRNAILVMVSVIDDGMSTLQSFWRLLSKAVSIGVFVTGTAFFASVQLLALPMAVMVVTLVLAAGVFGRAIASWITDRVSRAEPLIHVIVNTKEEACQIIAKILMLNKNSKDTPESEMRAIQVEINGHIFVNCRRVAKRSPWHIRILGIMAEPFDLARFIRRQDGLQSVPMRDLDASQTYQTLRR